VLPEGHGAARCAVAQGRHEGRHVRYAPPTHLAAERDAHPILCDDIQAVEGQGRTSAAKRPDQ